MNHETGTLISMHHGDKRQVTYTICLLYCCYCSVIIGEFKVNKSQVSFKKVLDSVLDRDVSTTEVVTDANCQIISIMSRFILV